MWVTVILELVVLLEYVYQFFNYWSGTRLLIISRDAIVMHITNSIAEDKLLFYWVIMKFWTISSLLLLRVYDITELLLSPILNMFTDEVNMYLNVCNKN